MTKIVVVGCGAIGSTILSYMTRSGRDIVGVDPWSSHVWHVQDKGMRMSSVSETFEVRPRLEHLDAVERGAFDVAVVAVKSYDASWAVDFAASCLNDGGIMVSAQNGLHEPDMMARHGSRVVGCVVPMAVEMFSPGSPRRTSGDEWTSLVFGELSAARSDERPSRLAELFSPLAPTESTDDIWGELWGKFTLNVMSNAVGGLADLTTLHLWTDPRSVECITALGHEVARVAAAEGQSPVPVLKSISHDLLMEASNSSTAAWQETSAILYALGESRSGARENLPSLLQDLRKGRRTEIDYLNGLVVDKACAHGIPVPANEAVVSIVHEIERGHLPRGGVALGALHAIVSGNYHRS
jgi:2-dehydropantoate 2-reductase